jgi:hypothetical protein
MSTKKEKTAPEAGVWSAQPFDGPAQDARLNVGDRITIYVKSRRFDGRVFATINEGKKGGM